MSNRPSQLEAVRAAEVLAQRLTKKAEVAVPRNVFLTLVADFLHRRDRERLARLARLTAQGNGGHSRRTGGYGDQVKAAAETLAAYLRESSAPVAELATVFGWAARLLPREVQKSSPGTGPRRDAHTSRIKKPTSETPVALPPAKGFGLDARSRAALASVRTKTDPNKPPEGEEGGAS